MVPIRRFAHPRLVLVTTTIMLVLAGWDSAAAAEPAVQCGQDVTRNITLTADLTGCPGSGLIVAADNITVNLAGHRIEGAGTRGSIGVQASGRDGVAIRNGEVQGFETGVLLQDGQRERVSHLTATRSTGAGIVLVHVTRTSVSGSRVSGTGGGDGPGIVLFESDGNWISHNELRQNGSGILLVESKGNQVTGNTSSDSGAGIELVEHATSNNVENNRTDRNRDTGILLDHHADDNVLSRNRASRNAFAGIAVGASDRVVVDRNRTSDNLGSGIAVGDQAVGTVVSNNRADRNGASPVLCQPECAFLDDGIHVDVPHTVLRNNRARDNADLGIEAPTTVTDAGGNRARGNGDPRQCTGVTCRR
jgi:parallel beta-helix repeat protein